MTPQKSMSQLLPPQFLERLKMTVPVEKFDPIVQHFSAQRPLSVRINTLKIGRDELLSMLSERKIRYSSAFSLPEALILGNITKQELGEMDLVQNAFLYIQSLSSQFVVEVLDPKPDDVVLDLCAAPGSKTTQMAAKMQNRGSIIAVEPIRDRFFRLKAVLTQTGAEIVSLKMGDGRRFRPADRLFDKILVDAPCSCEGRFETATPKTYAYWSPRKIKEMAHKQKGLLLAATRLLKPKGILVYSTCTFAPEENEAVVHRVLKKCPDHLELLPIQNQEIGSYPAVMQWGEKKFHQDIKNCFRICPSQKLEGFFIAKMMKRGDGRVRKGLDRLIC